MDALIIRLLGFTILLHEGFNLHYKGRVYLRTCFLPTLGLRLSPRAHTVLHAGFIAAAAGLVAAPRTVWLPFVFLVLLSLVIGSYAMRLSNHLALAWFITVLVCASIWLDGAPGAATPSPLLLLGLKGVVVMTYLFAFFHKLNAEYLSTREGWPMHLARFYCRDLGVKSERLCHAIGWVGIYGTIAAEGGIPVLLLVPRTTALGICLGIVFHLGLGFMDVMHFSTLMFACLLAFVPPATFAEVSRSMGSLGWPLFVAVGVVSLLVLRLFVPRPGPRWHQAARALQLSFVVAAVTLLAGCAVFFAGSGRFGAGVGWDDLGAVQARVLLVVWGLFLLNGLGPYLGLKTEFSFAMFSNLRSQPWSHLVFPAAWRPFGAARYVRIERIEGLPEREQLGGHVDAGVALNLLREHRKLQYTPYFFHEAIHLVCRTAVPAPTVRVRYAQGHEPAAEETFTASAAPRTNGHLRLNLFPFVMPLDPRAPHSELGSLAATLFTPQASPPAASPGDSILLEPVA